MSKLTDDMLRDWIQAVNADGTNWGMAIECMANDLLSLRAELAAIRGAGSQEKLIRIVRSMCLDNDMGTEPIEKWKFGWNLHLLLQQAARLPEESIDTFTSGEESDVNQITEQYSLKDLNEWLTEVFEDGEDMGIVTPAYPARERDVGDDNKIKEDFEVLWTTVGCEDVDIDLVRGLVLQLRDITLARGLKIAEQATLIECLKMDVLAAYAGSDEDLNKRYEEYTRALPGTLLPEDASQDLLYCGGEIFRDGVFEGFARQAKKIAEQAKEIERLNADVDRLDNAWNGMFLEWQQQTYATKRTAEDRDEAIGLLRWCRAALHVNVLNSPDPKAKRFRELTAK